MTALLARAIGIVQDLPNDEQNDIARAILALVGQPAEPEETDPDHLPDILEGLAQARRGEFATSEQIESVWRRFGP